MSIAKLIAESNKNDRFMLSFVTNIINTNITKNNRALCFVVNLGYIETDNTDSINEICSGDCPFEVLGDIEEGYNKDGSVVYRQKAKFSSLVEVIKHMKVNGISIGVSDNFSVRSETLINIAEVLKYIKAYNPDSNSVIDYMNNCCIIQLHCLIKSLGADSLLDDMVNEILKDHQGYLNRSLFLISSYNIENKMFGFFLPSVVDDERLYTIEIKDKKDFIYGFTSKNVRADKKKGVFKGGKNFRFTFA